MEPAEGVTTAELKNELAAMLPSEEYQVSEVINEAQIEADARQKSMPFFLISFFSLTMSVFIIYGSYKVIALDRLPVIGTFQRIGATQKAVIGNPSAGKYAVWCYRRPDRHSCRHIGLEIDPAGDGRIYFAGDRDSRGDFSVQYSFILCSGSDCVLTLCMASSASGKPSAHQRCGTWKCGGKNCPPAFYRDGRCDPFCCFHDPSKAGIGKDALSGRGIFPFGTDHCHDPDGSAADKSDLLGTGISLGAVLEMRQACCPEYAGQ